MRYHFFLHYGWFLQNFEKDFIPTLLHTTVIRILIWLRYSWNLPMWFGGLFKSNLSTIWTLLHNQTNQTNCSKFRALYAIYAANCIIIDHFLCLIIISSHSILIKSEKLEFCFQNSVQNKNLFYKYFDLLLLTIEKPGHI